MGSHSFEPKTDIQLLRNALLRSLACTTSKTGAQFGSGGTDGLWSGSCPSYRLYKDFSMRWVSIHSYELLYNSLSLPETIWFLHGSIRKCPIIQMMQNPPLLASLWSEALIFVNLASHIFVNIKNSVEG